MDDFLHRLRAGKDKRFDRSRKNYEPPQYRPVDRQNGNERRKKGGYKPQSSDQGNTTIVKALPALKSLLESIAEDRKQLTKLEERKTLAVEAIAVYLKKLAGYEGELAAGPMDVEPEEIQTMPLPDVDEPDVEEAEVEEPEVEEPEVDDTEKEEINFEKTLQLIKTLREEEGLSFEKIAQHLDANGISTPSGRGKWRGQAVSKLYA